MKILKASGATSQILQIFIADSSSTTGAGLTGLVFNTAGLTAYYHRKGDTTATAISLVTMTSGTFTSSGFVQIDATNMPGWYQLCPPNACFATGDCAIHLKGATNMAPLPIEIQITAAGFDPDVTAQPSAVVSIGAGAITATAIASGAITNTKFAANAIDAAAIADGAIDEATFATTAGAFIPLGIIDQGTGQSATSTGFVIRAGASFANSTLIGATLWVFGSTQGYWQRRLVTGNTTVTLVVDTWDVTPTGTLTYKLVATPPASLTAPAPAQVVDVTAAGAAKYFSVNSGTTYASAVSGSVVKEIAVNAATGSAPPSAATIAAAVCDEVLSGHVTSGTVGERLQRIPNVAPGANGGLPTTDANNAVKLQSGTGANQISLSSGAVLLQATQTGVTIPTVTNVGTVTSVTTVTGNVNGNVGGNVTGSVGSVTTVSDKTGYRLSSTGVSDIWDAVMESTVTARQMMRGFASALLSKISGADTTTVVVRDIADTKNRITATVDTSGNRSSVTTDLT